MFYLQNFNIPAEIFIRAEIINATQHSPPWPTVHDYLNFYPSWPRGSVSPNPEYPSVPRAPHIPLYRTRIVARQLVYKLDQETRLIGTIGKNRRQLKHVTTKLKKKTAAIKISYRITMMKCIDKRIVYVLSTKH